MFSFYLATFFEYFAKAFVNFNGLVVLGSLFFFIFSKKLVGYLDTSEIENKSQSEETHVKIKKRERIIHSINLLIIALYFITLYSNIMFLHSIIKTAFVILCIFLLNLWLHRKILIIYGKEIEISGETYLKKGYQANVFSLIVNVITFFVGIFVSLKMLGFDSILEMGGVWAGILAFMGFTAPVWATDMVAGIIILHSKSIEVGNVIHIKELGITAWIKSISLTEIKLIDLRYGHGIIMRPSKMRDLSIENYTLGVGGKSSKIHRSIEIKVGYENTIEQVEKVCYDAFDEMISAITTDSNRKYFLDEPTRNVEIESFGDYAVIYKFSYDITSPFYMIKAERLLNPYLQKYQKLYSIYFSTPDLIELKKAD